MLIYRQRLLASQYPSCFVHRSGRKTLQYLRSVVWRSCRPALLFGFWSRRQSCWCSFLYTCRPEQSNQRRREAKLVQGFMNALRDLYERSDWQIGMTTRLAYSACFLGDKSHFESVQVTSSSKLTANRRRRQDFPTPESPIRSSLNR